MLGGADKSNGEFRSYNIGADNRDWFVKYTVSVMAQREQEVLPRW
nr:hypothetical protein 49p1_00065 [Yersinia frederiksenii]